MFRLFAMVVMLFIHAPEANAGYTWSNSSGGFTWSNRQ